MPAPEPALSSSLRNLPPKLPPLAIPVVGALLVVVGLIAGRATAAIPRPLVLVGSPAAPPPAPIAQAPQVEPKQEPQPEPEPQQQQPPAPRCPSWYAPYQERLPPSEWTMSDEHFGPFDRCMTTIDLAFVQRVLPGYDVVQVPAPYSRDHHSFKVTKRGRPFLTIWPPGPDAKLEVWIHTPALETPWRVRVGDTVGALAARRRGFGCFYGVIFGEEVAWCGAGSADDDWADTLQYTIKLRSLGTGALGPGNVDPSRIAQLRIDMIAWKPGLPRQ